MKKNSLIFTLFITLFLTCKDFSEETAKLEIDENVRTFSDLIELAYHYRCEKDTSYIKLYNQLNDTISTKEYWFGVTSTTKVDVEKNVIRWGFSNSDEHFPHLTKNNCFIISVENKGRILIDERTVKVKDIKNAINKFYKRQENICKDKEKVINYKNLEYVEIPRLGSLLNVRIKKGRKLKISEWDVIFDCIDNVTNFYKERREELALKKWGVLYSQLDFDKKIYLDKIVRFVFFVVFIPY